MTDHIRDTAVEAYILNIKWIDADLPRNVGPFATRDEAKDWARRNIPNGTFEVWPLVRPYAAPKIAPASTGEGDRG